MTTYEIKENNPLTTWVQDRGGKIKYSGGKPITNLCPAVEHGSQHLCVSIDMDKQVWHCNDCDSGGSVIDWTMIEKGMTLKQAIEDLGGGDSQTQQQCSDAGGDSPAKLTKIYDYTNENGQLLYQVCRYEPKTFKQRQPKGEDWQWNLEGVTRVLYNLPKVLGNQFICLVEGEKDADTLNDLSFIATTNVGGSRSWLDAYASTLKGKDVYIFPDNDPAGEKLYQARLVSLDGKVNSAKRICVPKQYKDVTDWLNSEFNLTLEPARKAVLELIAKTPDAIEPIPLYTIDEMEERYIEYVQHLDTKAFSLKGFSPKFDSISKRLMPGELVMVMGDTGQGKTAVMQAIAKSATPSPTLFFELELPLTAMFSRSVQMEVGCHEEDVLHDYKEGKFSMRDKFKNMRHILTCDRSGISMDYIEKLIMLSELKFGSHPTLVMIDYMGLVKSNNKSRYEAMAEKAQQAKVLAKNTNTIVIMGSQVGRPPQEKNDAGQYVRSKRTKVSLHDGRGAGELEESSNLILGVTRPEEQLLNIEVLKNTRGPVGGEVEFMFDGQKMQLTPI